MTILKMLGLIIAGIVLIPVMLAALILYIIGSLPMIFVGLFCCVFNFPELERLAELYFQPDEWRR